MKEIGRSAKTKVVAFLLAASFLAVAFSSVPTPVGATPAPGDVFDFHSLIGNIGGASPGSPAVAGINPAGAAWIVGASEVDLSASGLLYVSMQGLYLASSNTVGSVTSVQAVLACQTASGYSTVTTSPVPLNSLGDATISSMITPPSPCYAPVVLVEKGAGTSYFATTGYSAVTSSDTVDFNNMIGNVGGASPGSPVIAGINPAGAAWIIGPSSVDLNGGAGTIQVNIQGLLFLSSFTVGTVNTVQATVACQIATGYSTVTTTPVALSAAGSATISQAITLPSPCYAPTVLIQKGGGTSYFAATGYFSATNIQQDQAVLGVSGAIYTVEAAPNVYIQGTYP